MDRVYKLKFSSFNVFCYLYGYEKIRLLSPEEIQDIAEREKGMSAEAITRRDHCKNVLILPDKQNIKATRPIKIPEEISLCTSSLPGAKFGACAMKNLPAGTWFGPFEGKLVRRDHELTGLTSEYMWEIFHDGEVSHFLDGKGENSWMTFVQCARHKREQNMVVFQYHGCIYYRTTKEVHPGSELLVWYDSKYPQLLGIPLSWNDNRGLSGKRKQVSSPPGDRARKRRGSALSDTKVEEHGLALTSSPCRMSVSINNSFVHYHPKMTSKSNEMNLAPGNRIRHAYHCLPLQPYGKPRGNILESWNGFTCGTCMYTYQTKETYEKHRCRKQPQQPSSSHHSQMPTEGPCIQYTQRMQPNRMHSHEDVRAHAPYQLGAPSKVAGTRTEPFVNNFPVPIKQI